MSSLTVSINYYCAIPNKPLVLTDDDFFLNQMLGLLMINKSELVGIKISRFKFYTRALNDAKN